jgi:hypothetical protein
VATVLRHRLKVPDRRKPRLGLTGRSYVPIYAGKRRVDALDLKPGKNVPVKVPCNYGLPKSRSNAPKQFDLQRLASSPRRSNRTVTMQLSGHFTLLIGEGLLVAGVVSLPARL